MMKLIDTHAHLCHPRLAGQVDAVLERAKLAGVVGVVCAAGDLAESVAGVELAGRCANVWFTAGVHPHEAKDAAAGYLDRLTELAAGPRCVAVGEIGLDYHYDFSPRDAQRRVFAEQLALAGRTGKPVVIHTREALDDTLAVLRESLFDASHVVFHSCTEGPAGVRRMLDIGATVSFSGIATFRNADDVRQAAALVPAERILIETDSPYLSPEPVRSMKTNEPANVAHVCAHLAETLGQQPDALAEATTTNAMRFFKLSL